MIHMKDWEKLDLRVGKILEVEDHPNADKLFVLTVDLGEGKTRTIVAGLKKYCSKEHLKGKSAVFIINLEPAEIRGVKSEGMILAAISHTHSQRDDPKVCLITPDGEMDLGSKIR
jgi:methionyl-tRNA synthetase